MTLATRLAAWWTHATRVAAVIRLKPFDSSTPEGRSKERYRRLTLTTLSSATARAITIATSLFSIPLTINYLGAERYGMWVTTSSVVSMLAFADLGMGNGLINAIAESHGRGERERARQYVSSAFFMLLSIAALILLALAAASPFVPWPRLFNVATPLAMREAGATVLVVVACFALNMPLGIVQRVQIGYQEGFANNVWQVLGSLLGLVGVLVAIHFELGLPWLVGALLGAPVVATLLNGVVLFGVQRPWLLPQPRHITRPASRRILKTGTLFFALQLAGAIGYQSDNLVIAQLLGAEQVAQYAVPMKLFSLVPLLLSFALVPLWPAYGEAITRGDIAWVRKALRRSLVSGLLVVVPVVSVLVLLGRPILRLWVGNQISPTPLLLAGLGMWAIMSSINGPLAMFYNGATVIRFQVITSTLMATANIALSIFLVQRIGVAGAIFGTVTAQLCFIFLPACFYIPRLLAQMQARAEQRAIG